MIESTDETKRLRQYTLDKQGVTTTIRSLIKFFEERNRPEVLEQLQEPLVKLAEDRFNLAVVGQFKRGKSSLMNAVIGRDLLPTGLLPLTSAITTLCYGPQERVVLRRKGWLIEQEIPLNDLPEYVTEQGNPGNEKGLLEARVELPVRFLRRGLHFIDTPGIGSTRRENSLTTYAFLPEADAVIFVTSVEAPLSEAESNFLQDIRQYVRKLFVVVNKVDLLAPGERDQVLEYIQAGLRPALGVDQGWLHPLSARQALAAKLSRDSTALQQSGLKEFEAALVSFLADEKGQVFLVAILDRALRLLEEECWPDIEPDAHPAPDNDSPIAPGDSFQHLREAITSLRSWLLLGKRPILEPPFIAVTELKGNFLEQAITSSPSRQPDLRRASLHSGTCPICAVQSQTLFDFFADAQYALVTTEAAQRTFAQEHGFCGVHTWQFQRIASPQGLSQGYAFLIDAGTAELRRSVEQPIEAIVTRLDTILSNQTCAACRLLQETERTQFSEFLAQITTPAGHEFYSRSPGLCLPHLRAVLLTSPPRAVVEYLLQEQVRHLEEISEDMRSYVLKRDALRRGLNNRDEETAWRRALVQLAGEQSVCLPGR